MNPIIRDMSYKFSSKIGDLDNVTLRNFKNSFEKLDIF